MRYRTQSANVLNEADRMGRILDFQLFCMEQESKFWGYNEAVDWIPGDPIYQDPRQIIRLDACTCCDHDENEELEGYYGNHVRPMFEIFDDGDRYPSLRCKDCEVSWMGDYAGCWVCGKECPVPAIQTSWGHIVWSHSMTDLATIPDLRSQIERGLRIEIGERWRERIAESMNNFSIGMELMGDSLRGFSASLHSFDEVRLPHFFVDPYAAYSIAPYIPPPPPANPFEVPKREIELIPRVAADLSQPVRGRVRLPANLDLSGRVEPPLPQMPEPRVFPTYQEQYAERTLWQMANPPMTQQRRRRN